MTVLVGRRPANGTEGDSMRARCCDRCTRDHEWHTTQTGDSCPIIMDALVGDHSYPNPDGPPEWSIDLDTFRWSCSAFVGPCPCQSGPA